jgi:anaerobic ribonucleoside-triphosphate reductase
MKAWAELGESGSVIRFHKTKVLTSNRIVRCEVFFHFTACPTCRQDMTKPPNSKGNRCPQCGQGRGVKR